MSMKVRFFDICDAVEIILFCYFVTFFRAMFRRMLSDPDPMKTLFMNGKSRRYQKDPSSGDWTLIND